MDSKFDKVVAQGRTSGPLVGAATVSLFLFLFAIQLLGAATAAAAAPLEQFFRQYVAGSAQALGASWLATYVLTNGSVVAALSVSLFKTEVLTASQLFLMLAGSRLGGAAIVLLIGTLDYFQKQRYSFSDSTRLGILTFLLSHSIYLPATALGYLLLPRLQTRFESVGNRIELSFQPLAAFDPATGAVVDTVGVGLSLVVAVLVLFGSLMLFDRVLKRIDTEWLRKRFFRRFQHKWTSFGLGILITGVTTSVAFSLGVVVPLYNRDYIKRQEIVPYVLGANIGTFFDTIVIAVLLESPQGVAIVLSLVAVGTVITVGTLVLFSTYFQTVETIQTRIITDRRYLTGFLISLVVFPILLVLLPI
ncbi:sodium:phosphate symporter [Haloferax sp. MBLA0076]|uniref:Sodium:phosphate symporter n=1 Tax=Haloferax litoreum TaxID=2666140 RepID=A0A6A8GJQ5_9EURY|nr:MULTISPECIES: sodium:phosphate symporter [Haloferax]KAB1190518.1 sodium:phosphate symporter [Haloferax sp. CBA1148]MRX23498.1 sodium:phosphate symporter [Haloferax litoreum]